MSFNECHDIYFLLGWEQVTTSHMICANLWPDWTITIISGIILRMGSANERRHIVTSQDLYSLSGRTSYKATRFQFRHFQSLWHLTDASTAALLRCLSNFRVMRSFKHPISWIPVSMVSCGKMSVTLVNRHPGSFTFLLCCIFQFHHIYILYVYQIDICKQLTRWCIYSFWSPCIMETSIKFAPIPAHWSSVSGETRLLMPLMWGGLSKGWGLTWNMKCTNAEGTSARREQHYRKTCNISRTSVGNKIVDHSDVVGASPDGAAPTTSSFST